MECRTVGVSGNIENAIFGRTENNKIQSGTEIPQYRGLRWRMPTVSSYAYLCSNLMAVLKNGIPFEGAFFTLNIFHF